ncbi:MAG: DUF2807 domain-containing protein [Flavobacterium sp.]|nr:DUF2807 domain-containing protein [Flavobacterium sp.]
MQKVVVVVVVFLSQLGFSQNSVTKKLGDFTKVTSFDQIDVLLVPSNENKIILSGEGANEVELVTKNDELKIRMPLTKLLKGEAISATVYYKNIDAVEANEGSRIASEATFNSINFDIIAKEGSEIKLKLDVERVSIKASDGSKIDVEGNATNQEVLVNTGGIYEAEKLRSKLVSITVNAGGEAAIFATDFVDAKVRAGDIVIFGKPKQINQKVIAGGTITESKE